MSGSASRRASSSSSGPRPMSSNRMPELIEPRQLPCRVLVRGQGREQRLGLVRNPDVGAQRGELPLALRAETLQLAETGRQSRQPIVGAEFLPLRELPGCLVQAGGQLLAGELRTAAEQRLCLLAQRTALSSEEHTSE